MKTLKEMKQIYDDQLQRIEVPEDITLDDVVSTLESDIDYGEKLQKKYIKSYRRTRITKAAAVILNKLYGYEEYSEESPDIEQEAFEEYIKLGERYNGYSRLLMEHLTEKNYREIFQLCIYATEKYNESSEAIEKKRNMRIDNIGSQFYIRMPEIEDEQAFEIYFYMKLSELTGKKVYLKEED